MSDGVAAPADRRAGDGAPTLRAVVEALIDGVPVAWERAEGRGCTTAEQRMTQELRALVAMTAAQGTACVQALQQAGRPRVLERVLGLLAMVQVSSALVAWPALEAALVVSPARAAGLAATTAVALAFLTRRHGISRSRLIGHLVLLLAAWQARPILDVATASGAPVWLRAIWQAVVVEAFLPLAIWRLAHESPPPARLSRFERASAVMFATALASSLCLAVASAWPRLLDEAAPADDASRWLMLTAVTWAGLAATTMIVRRRRGPATILAAAPPARRVTLRACLASRIGAWRGMAATDLAALAADMQRARSPREVAEALQVHVRRVVGGCAPTVVVPGAAAWSVLAGQLPALPADSGVASLLASADEPLRVDPRARVHRLLPAVDQAWLAAAGVGTLVRMAAQDGTPLAGLVVPTRGDGRPHSGRQRAFIAAAARTGAVALAAMGERTGRSVRPADEDLAYECGTCGVVTAQRQPCACGGSPQLAALPACVRGTFRVERKVGQGGMGVVYLGRDLQLDRPVALKTMPTLSSSCVTSLRAEARAMAAIEHGSIAVIYGLEEWRGTPVLVAEYLPGGTLAARLAAGPLPVRVALAVAIDLADALAALHAGGWLHRDIKPSNIGFCRAGVPKLLDFGLTHWTTEETAAAFGPVSGTPLYLSPELLEGAPASEHDDIWALALVVVEMITGAHPFRATSLDELLVRVRRGGCTDACRWAGRMPPAVAALLAQALHPSRGQRLASARSLAASLRTAAVSS